MSVSSRANENEPTVKLKDPLLFSNGHDEYRSIVTFDTFSDFWIELGRWVRAMTIECPEEQHEEWFSTWESHKKFRFDDPNTPKSLITVCIMQNTKYEFTILHVLEQLARDIPYLGNHIYFTAGDEQDLSAVVKMKMFQHYQFQNPYVSFHDPDNPYNDLVSTGENEEENQSVLEDSQAQYDQYTEDNTNDEKRKTINGYGDNDDSLISYSESPEASNENTSNVSSRQRRNRQSLRNIIQSTCKEEMATMQNTIIAEITKVLFQQNASGPDTSNATTSNATSTAVVSMQPSDGPPQQQNAQDTNEDNTTPQQRASSAPPIINQKSSQPDPVVAGNQSAPPTLNTPAMASQQQLQSQPHPVLTPDRNKGSSHQQRPSKTYQSSKYSRRQPTPPTSNPPKRWNSSWRHKSNPNYQANPPTSAPPPVRNPYKPRSRPPGQVQFNVPPPAPSQAGQPRNPQHGSMPTQQTFHSVSGSSFNVPHHNRAFSATQQFPSSNPQPVHPTNVPHNNQHGVPLPSGPSSSVPTSNQQHMGQMNYNRPTANPTMFQQHQQHSLVKGGVVQFIYNGLHYELRDTDFTKYAGDLLNVTTTDDIIHFYKHLQSMAIQRNIFVTDFDKLFYWDRAMNQIPPTCMFTSISATDNTELAYKRMRSVLYQKISAATFNRPEHQAIVMNYAVSQDGFALLYDLAARCHPHLLAKTSRYNRYNNRPQMTSEDNIFTLKRKYETWLEIERVDHHVYTDECVLRYIMQDLGEDTRYEKALQQLRVDLATHETMKRHTTAWVPFPVDLMLHNLPQTVMACYDDDEKDSLFSEASISKMTDSTSGTERSNLSDNAIEEGYVRTIFASGDENDIQAFINVMKQSQRLPARSSVDKFCKGCGKFGHDVFHQGCDFCAQLSIALKFLEKHPDEVKQIIKTYMRHQKKRQSNRSNNERNYSGRNKSYNKKKTVKATVKSISSAIQSALNSLASDSDSDDEIFEDASDTPLQEERESSQHDTGNN